MTGAGGRSTAEPWVTTPDGTRISVHDLGGPPTDEEPTPTLVMAHALSFHGQVWKPVADRLADRFHCVALDMRGHGASDLPPGWDFDWRGFASDILAVADDMDGANRPHAVGHSSGGTALLLAEQARPGTFAAIWCYEPVVVAANPPLGRDPDSWMAARARRRRDVFPSRDDAYRAYAAKEPFSTFAPRALRLYVDDGFEDVAEGGVRLKCRPETEAGVAEMATANHCFGRLGQITCPVTVVTGAESEGLDPSVFERVVDALPEGRLETLPHLTHYGPFEDPEAVATSIRHAFNA